MASKSLTSAHPLCFALINAQRRDFFHFFFFFFFFFPFFFFFFPQQPHRCPPSLGRIRVRVEAGLSAWRLQRWGVALISVIDVRSSWEDPIGQIPLALEREIAMRSSKSSKARAIG